MLLFILELALSDVPRVEHFYGFPIGKRNNHRRKSKYWQQEETLCSMDFPVQVSFGTFPDSILQSTHEQHNKLTVMHLDKTYHNNSMQWCFFIDRGHTPIFGSRFSSAVSVAEVPIFVGYEPTTAQSDQSHHRLVHPTLESCTFHFIIHCAYHTIYLFVQ